jgi:thiol:disulfide interchange protein
MDATLVAVHIVHETHPVHLVQPARPQPMLHRFTLLLAALLALGAIPATAAGPHGADVWNSAEIQWRDMRTGVQEATSTGKPVLMLLQATWCPSCKKYQRVFRDQRVVAASRDLVMILVDIDKEPQVNGAFSPDGVYVPRTIFLDPTGEIRHDLKGSEEGYPHSLDTDDPGELLALMKRAAAGGKTEPPAEVGRTL